MRDSLTAPLRHMYRRRLAKAPSVVRLMTRYFLSKHVYYCVRGDELVFLDLRADKYFSMAAAKARAFAPELASNSSPRELVETKVVPAPESGQQEASSQPQGNSAIATLLSRGLLTTDGTTGKPIVATPNETPRSDLSSELLRSEPHLYLSDALKFLRAVISAWLVIKLRPLEGVVGRVRLRRESRGLTVSIDLSVAKRCVALFERMRPFAFSAHNACLFESLALSEFLAIYNLYPQWVFAVQTTPFTAHCWLQHSRIALNDSVEHAGEFTPIMII